jgi:crotonobetainyl-CoA:carnitine CoA-transferase CaiB-like acyl-CoA transferase
MLEQIDHPQYGPLTVPHSPLHVGDYRADLEPSPALGQDNAAVYGGWLGLSEAQLADLAEREVI